MRIARHAHRPRLLVGTVLVLLALPLAGCAALSPNPNPSPAPSSPSTTSTAAASATPTATPTLAPEQSAEANLAYFDSIASAVAETNPVDGRAYVDALVAGGFDKGAMQLSFDRTHVDLAADSVEFSVLFNDECLIGQRGPATGGYHSMAAAVLGSGTCLLGVTRPLDG
ncbi:DUF6993 domain-containing protein [Cryobacterium psychrophilum]|uniref:DUF6993 domain-containing protein n=1 Tax=Cryobacterium psychrophilum TaxID=41988 RepID=A0A4Y8KMI0_9MICO|nr:hypothetical protein [Cryobacterium psychrophilum]TDW31301.1 hypothetical protein EDD25_3107 [Cryobacterium psychrophilum]TFD78415.1 hypothetical protein E3T53_09450 [Cryobacterium psychrophilum]